MGIPAEIWLLDGVGSLASGGRSVSGVVDDILPLLEPTEADRSAGSNAGSAGREPWLNVRLEFKAPAGLSGTPGAGM